MPGVALILTVGTAAHIGQEWPAKVRRSMPLGTSPMQLLRFMPQVLRWPAWSWDFLIDGFADRVPDGPSRDGKKMTMFEAIATVFRPDAPVPT
jgi:hypothetical protein